MLMLIIMTLGGFYGIGIGIDDIGDDSCEPG